MAEYYFDMETTGTDFDKDEIMTIQWQELDRFTGEPIGELHIKTMGIFRRGNNQDVSSKFNM